MSSEPVKILSQAELDQLPEEEQRTYEVRRAAQEAMEQASLPYTWRQTLSDVDVTVPVPEGSRSRDLTVELKRGSIKVGVKGKEPILSGPLCKEIKVDDSTWTLDDQKEVAVHLEKANDQQWWSCVVEGAPKIDTTKISPENSKLSDLDGETRAMVEKMMFDNQQKQMGKPTSEEAQKQQMLNKFMAEHPEMDFSQAKTT